MMTHSNLSLRWLLQRFGPLVALILLAAGTAACEHFVRGSDSFISPVNIVSLLLQNAALGIVALGMTFVIISGGIDLSVGAMLALAGVAGVWLLGTMMDAAQIVEMARQNIETGFPAEEGFTLWFSQHLVRWGLAGHFGLALTTSIALILLAGVLAGLLNGVLVTRGKLAPFVATLGTMTIFRSVAMILAGSGEVRVPATAEQFQSLGGGGIALPFLHQFVRGAEGEALRQPIQLGYPVVIFAVLLLFAIVLLNRTRFGRYVFAVGSNEKAAFYSGINVNRIKLWTYALLGLCCGVAALLTASRQSSVASGSTGVSLELSAIAAVAIGGTSMRGGSGTLLGTLVGVLLLGVIGNMLNMLNVSSNWQGCVTGIIIIVAVLVQRGRKA